MLDGNFVNILSNPMVGSIGTRLGKNGLNAAQSLFEDAVELVSADRRRPPDPSFVGPLLSRGRFHVEEGRIREMFVQLLARGIDREHRHVCHPAFIDMVSKLSADDARILDGVYKATVAKRSGDICRGGLRVRRHYKRKYQEGWQLDTVEFRDPIELDHPENRKLYIQHLDRLGLIFDERAFAMDPDDDLPMSPYDTLTGMEAIESNASDEFKRPNSGDVRMATDYVAHVGLTELGEQFMDACTPGGLD